MIIDNSNKLMMPSDALIGPTDPNALNKLIATTSSIMSIVSIILGIISIFFIVKALKNKKNTKAICIWILMYVISIITRTIPEIIGNQFMNLDYELTFWNIYGSLILNIITLIIRIVMIIYPIHIIRKNKKENK